TDGWPTKLRESFAHIRALWESPRRSIPKQFTGKYAPATLIHHLTWTHRYVRFLLSDLANQLPEEKSAQLEGMTFGEIWKPRWILAFGDWVYRRLTERDRARFPWLLPSEIEQPTQSLRQWYAFA